MSESISFVESDMTFGPFPTDSLYRIENAAEFEVQYRNGCKMSEAVVCRPEKNSILSIEAKTSFANPRSAEHGGESFQVDVQEIVEKLENSIDFFLKAKLCDYVPGAFSAIDYRTVTLLLILVIKTHSPEWLPDVQDALNQQIRSERRFDKLWHTEIVVLNEEMARRRGLVQ